MLYMEGIEEQRGAFIFNSPGTRPNLFRAWCGTICRAGNDKSVNCSLVSGSIFVIFKVHIILSFRMGQIS